jgi:hypothetical protein
MYKQFLEAVLPSQGNYCIFTLTDGKPKTRFAENGSIEDASKFIEAFKQQPPTNIYFALSSFDGFSRKADDSIYIKSFFLDLDVGKEKNSYATKNDAYAGLDAFITALNLPAPVVVDSGNGLHVYWILKEAVETSVWKPYAEKFKELCHQHKLVIDPAVPADAARVLRVPFTKNYGKDGTVKDVVLINDELYTYDFDEIVSCFGEVATSENKENTFDLKNNRKGLTDEEKQSLGLDKYEHEFEEIAVKSLEGAGCAQIKFIIENALLVRSRSGTLEYLSPLGVLMLIQLSTNYQKTTQTMMQEKQNERHNKASTKQDGRTGATSLRNSTQADAKVVRLKVKSTLRLPWAKGYESPSRGLMIPQTQPNQKKYK